MFNDLEFIINIFEISYAPSTWKAEHFGWNLKLEKQKAKNAILESRNAKQFQKIIKDFCLTTRDYHVVPMFFSTEKSSLPFHLQGVGGKYYVSFIDPDVELPFSVGDQILFFNGVPIQHAIEEFCSRDIGNNHTSTDKALGEFYFTNRTGSSGYEILKGEVEISYFKTNQKNSQKCTLSWDYRSELIKKAKFKNFSKCLLQNIDHRKHFITPHYNLIRSVCTDNNEPSDLLGARKSRIPTLGQTLWKSPENGEFHAYLFLFDNENVGGYIRIPSYAPFDGDKAALEFAEIIELFQEVSDILVVDQLNNGGGYILYLYALMGMLTDYELELPMHRIKLTQEDIFRAVMRNRYLESIDNDEEAREKLGDSIEGIIVNHKLAKNIIDYQNFIINQWNFGKIFTDFCYLYGIEKIAPHPEINYTKPILILTNSLDFSAADFFPAIMKDNKRALLLGTTTAGAGGYTEKISFPNLNGIEEIGITASFAVRKNGIPIENFGIEPDILYEVTEKDLQNNYVEYKQKILDVLKDLLLKRA
jgi:hypothetical protein